MQSTGHSSMQALSFRSTQGCAMTYVTGGPPGGRVPDTEVADALGSDSSIADDDVPLAPGLLWRWDVDAGNWRKLVGPGVVVRPRLTDGGLTDAVGLLISVDDVLLVDTRRGPVRVALDQVVAGKP